MRTGRTPNNFDKQQNPKRGNNVRSADYWLRNLIEQAKEAPSSAAGQGFNRTNASIAETIEAMAAYLNQCAATFNEYAGRSMQLSYCPPERLGDGKIIHSRISTTSHSLALEGHSDRIVLTIIPASDLFRFLARSTPAYEPLFQLIRFDGSTDWVLQRHEANGRTTADEIVRNPQRVCQEAFEAFMQQSTTTPSAPFEPVAAEPSPTSPQVAFKALLNKTESADEVSEIRREFMQEVGHDLRAPLSSLSAGLQMFAKGAYGELDERGEQRLEQLQKLCGKVTEMVNQLLEVEKLATDSKTLVRIPASLEYTISEAVCAVEPTANSKSVEIRVDMQGDAAALIDQNRIIQVLQNLLSNAVRFSSPHSQVCVYATLHEHYWEVAVRDFGPGVAPEYQKRIFEKFGQARTPAKADGFGLGLAICKNIIEMHGGAIGVRNEAEGGCTFWFTLPAANSSASSGKYGF